VKRGLAALLVLAVACGGGDDEPEAQLSLQPSTTTTTTPEVAALAERLPVEVGAGLTRADDVVGAGLLDLAGAAAAASDPDAELELLERTGFERGVSRAWIAVGGATVYISLYEFGDEAGAAAYDDAQAGLLTEQGATPFDAGIGRGFTTVEGELTAHAVLLRDGVRWALVLVASEDGSLDADRAAELAAAL
jgi:hypothetical protein